MTPDDPIARLLALEQFGIKLGLDNIRRVVAALGNPQDRFTSVHIAGTNGKGSVTAMVERALRHAGRRTGRYTSPHLSRLEERIAIDGVPIRPTVFRALVSDVLAVVDRLRASGALETTPTFFEASTAVAFEAFRREAVDVAVIEVGLGGRFDATNVLTPRVAAITTIALDHQVHLGSTLASIAFEKAGIIKHGIPVVVGELPVEARAVVADVAAERGADIVEAGLDLIEQWSVQGGTAVVTVATPRARYANVRLGLRGRHQIANAVVAIRILETLGEHTLQVAPDDIVAGLTEVEWPARLEWLRLDGGRELLLDAAHNAAGAQALADYLWDSGVAPLPIVLAVMKDKDVGAMVEALARAASRFVATSVRTARAFDAAALAAHVTRAAPAVPVDIEAAADRAVAKALGEGARAAAAGSIFFVGPLRERLLAAGAISLQGR